MKRQHSLKARIFFEPKSTLLITFSVRCYACTVSFGKQLARRAPNALLNWMYGRYVQNVVFFIFSYLTINLSNIFVKQTRTLKYFFCTYKSCHILGISIRLWEAFLKPVKSIYLWRNKISSFSGRRARCRCSVEKQVAGTNLRFYRLSLRMRAPLERYFGR